MSKLWIVHRRPGILPALARASGLAAEDLAQGAPASSDAAFAGVPAAVLIGLEGDFEQELEFAHRQRERLHHAHWILLCDPGDVDEARRLFDVSRPDILTNPPDLRALRKLVARATAKRSAQTLAERRHRERIAQRFSAWLGGLEMPGLLRALDPALSNLPMLVRGAPGSGRALLGRYVELFRGGRGPLLRLHARDVANAGTILEHLKEAPSAPAAIWIDELDALPTSAQNTLADWILHDTPATRTATAGLRWIATAGPEGPGDRLEPALEQAFAPLSLAVPSLTDHPMTLQRFAEEVAKDWTRSVGGVPRRFAASAIAALQATPWPGDRAEVEAILRCSLAGSGAETLEEVDLRFPNDLSTPGPERTEALDLQEAPHLSGAAEVPDEDDEALFSHAPSVSPPVGTGEEAIERATVLPLLGEESEGSAATGAVDEAGWSPDHEAIANDDYDESARLSAASFEQAGEARVSQDIATSPAAAPGGEGGSPGPNDGWRRLARSLDHEIRNPLVSIRTFAELLPEHFDDENFRERFSELVGKDVAHIDEVLSRLSSVAEREKLEPEAVDVSAMLEGLLEERRDRIGQGRLLVLRELEREAPRAWADGHCLRVALAGLLDRALKSLPERGDLFVATRFIERGADGAPKLRVLLRHHNPELAGDAEIPLAELDPTANLIEYVLAESVIEASGGTLTIDSTDAHETLVLVDLRTRPGGHEPASHSAIRSAVSGKWQKLAGNAHPS